jgi:hypothetical protein
MRRLQTLITIILETRAWPCRIAVRADRENYSRKDCFRVNSIRPRKQFRLTITLNSAAALSFSENRTPKIGNRHAVATSFSQGCSQPPAPTGLLEQRP